MSQRSKSIVYEVINKFTETKPLVLQMPYDRKKAMDGHYSKIWKRLKNVFVDIERVIPQHIQVKFQKNGWKTDRTIFKFDSGILLDMPNDSTAYDFTIVVAQLKVLQMKFGTSREVR
jgi:hypothetical protein